MKDQADPVGSFHELLLLGRLRQLRRAHARHLRRHPPLPLRIAARRASWPGGDPCQLGRRRSSRQNRRENKTLQELSAEFLGGSRIIGSRLHSPDRQQLFKVKTGARRPGRPVPNPTADLTNHRERGEKKGRIRTPGPPRSTLSTLGRPLHPRRRQEASEGFGFSRVAVLRISAMSPRIPARSRRVARSCETKRAATAPQTTTSVPMITRASMGNYILKSPGRLTCGGSWACRSSGA